ncbi:MAG: TetR/AcrR family transcriptional regulator, partial [Myxococcota bacterium]
EARRNTTMGLREGKKKRVRQNIQTAAVELFRERGFGGTRVREIIERVQISESTFFNYYATKDAVLNEWAHEKVSSALTRNANRACLPLRDEIGDRARSLAAEISEDRAFLTTVWQRVRLAPPSQDTPGPAGELSEFIAARQSRGEIRDAVPAQQVAVLITSLVMSTISNWLTDRNSQAETLETRLIRAINLFFDGCAASSLQSRERVTGERWAQLGAR